MGDIITRTDKRLVAIAQSADKMLDRLEQLEGTIKPALNGERYLTDKELSERLRLSRKTLQTWRNEGTIEYIQLEGKILYTESAVQRVLEKHLCNAWE